MYWYLTHLMWWLLQRRLAVCIADVWCLTVTLKKVGREGLEASWAGGEQGREVSQVFCCCYWLFLEQLIYSLGDQSLHAICFWLAVSWRCVLSGGNKGKWSRLQLTSNSILSNNVSPFIADICSKLATYGLNSKTIMSRRARNEFLSVIKFCKQPWPYFLRMRVSQTLLFSFLRQKK